MKKHYIQGLGMVEENEENLPLLIKKGIVKEEKKTGKKAKVTIHDTNKEESDEQDNSNAKRTSKRKSS